jgi:hypothetical protein
MAGSPSLFLFHFNFFVTNPATVLYDDVILLPLLYLIAFHFVYLFSGLYVIIQNQWFSLSQ